MPDERNIVVLSERFPGFGGPRTRFERIDDVAETYSLLWFLPEVSVSEAEVRDWTPTQRCEAANWATAVHLWAAGLVTTSPGRRPAFLIAVDELPRLAPAR